MHGCSSRRIRATSRVLPVVLLAALLWQPVATVAAAATVSATAATATSGAPATGATTAAGAYRRPVPGPVVARFDAQAPYGPGHRGVDLATEPGEKVRAAARGRVAFAGAVAGQVWVSIDHPDGVRTSYGPLEGLRVATGQRVASGAVLGGATPGHRADGRVAVHVGARRGGAYIDPLGLFEPELWRPTLVGPGGWTPADEPDVPRYEPWDGRHDLLGRVPGSPVARGPGWLTAPNPNHVIGVAGFGSHTGNLPIDLSHLGYAPQDITYLSYAGRQPGGAPGDPHRDQLPYDRQHTWQHIHDSALRLRAQLRAQWARRPGQAVDLVGHSQGGVVIAYYLMVLHDPADPTLPPVSHAATIASPLDGSDWAALVVTARQGLVGRGMLALGEAWKGIDADAPAITDLAPGSEVIRAVEHAWQRARRDPWTSPLATGTQVMTFGGSRDWAVPEHRTELAGAQHVVLPGGHSQVRDTEAARIALRAFLADQPVPGEAGGSGHLVSYARSALVQGLRPTVLGADLVLLRRLPVP